MFASFAQIAALSDASGYVLQSSSIDVARARFRLYLVTQATVLGAGWFAGTASRGRRAALLHSGLLVVACYLVFRVTGMI